ncbi:MAG: tryptophan-rich sensory protein [Ignavibacteria bacterium]|nr:tryptophan-rich sensory protein [Bacteroidota bacterium]MBL7128071.1 tryptophan-rich sensory protein [Ignavibacteria bacterium]
MKNTFKLIISILIPLIIGFLGSFFTASSVDSWYATINKPSFNPPGWIFAPVWTTLYILIGLSFYLVWMKNFGEERKKVIIVYSMQLLFNLLWSVLFFGLKSPLLGLIDIIILLSFIIANTIIFYKISKTAGYLLIPYLLWVSFASILNFSIFQLN